MFFIRSHPTYKPTFGGSAAPSEEIRINKGELLANKLMFIPQNTTTAIKPEQ